MNQIERNLLLFLDPIGRYSPKEWVFINSQEGESPSFSSQGQNVIFSFSRTKLLDYYIQSLKMFLLRKKECRKLLFINDGLLSSIFDASNSSAYRAFSEKHLPKPNTLRQRLIALLPLVLRAEVRFIVVLFAPTQSMSSNNPEISDLEANDFMFFSNAAGKLLLLKTETLQTGHGLLAKTTTDVDYVSVMVKEFDTVMSLSGRLGRTGYLPEVRSHLEVRSRHFFTEDYVPGENLRELLRVLGRQKDSKQVCSILDGLDEWFDNYQSCFCGIATPISSLYAHVPILFSGCYGNAGAELLKIGVDLIDRLENRYPVVTPVLAHNDLWPGNLVVTKNGFIVLDWERAAESRAPFFDFFWMVISTAIESLACETKNHNYSSAVRTFLCFEDDISRHAYKKLVTFLDRMDISEEFLPYLLFLFLMEWSVQGYQVIGMQTDMDRLAFGELVHYADVMYLKQADVGF